MSETDENATLFCESEEAQSSTLSLLLNDTDATSDTDVEPASPGGSTKGLYVRSRPTSMDGSSIIDFPGFAPDNLDFARFGLTPAATVSPTLLEFPPPPVIAMPPPGKKRRYATSVKSLYTGTGTGTSLRTDRAAIIPLKAIPREPAPATPVPVVTKRNGWTMLKKIVPGLFPRPSTGKRAAVLTALDANAKANVNAGGMMIEPPSSTPSPTASTHNHTRSTSSFAQRTRALSIRSLKSGKSKSKGVENRAPPPPPLPLHIPPVPGHVHTRVHSFSGYLADAADADDDEDETDPEMTAIQLEALATALRINERFEFAPVDPEEIGVAL